RHAVSTTSGSSPNRVASSRPTCATSSECVSRLRAKSNPAAGLSTCVFAASRRNALECSSRARSRAKSLRLLECSSGNHRARSRSPYPETASATAVLDFCPGEFRTMHVAEFVAVEPVLRKGGALGSARATARPLGRLARVLLRPVQLPEQVVHLLQALHGRETRPQVAAHGVTLEVPRDMLSDVAAGVILIATEELDEQFGVPAQRRRDG